MPKTWS